MSGMAGSSGTASSPVATEPAKVDDTLVRPTDAECEYVEVRARQDAAGSPYIVPASATDSAQCFLVDLGFESATQALGFSALIEHPEAISYMVLRMLDRSENRGPLVTCDDAYPTHRMVGVWAPGFDDWYYPKDMGIDLGRGLFLLEVRYANKTGKDLPDNSGMKVCTTKKLRPRTASMSWLGSQLFSIPAGAKDHVVNGRCTPTEQTEPVHLLRVAPFMKGLGKRASMRIERIDGSVQPLLDQPYGAGMPKSFDLNGTVRVGDSVVSSCVYDNPSLSSVGVGVSSADELCHFFVLAYPAYQLVNDGGLENNSCVGR
jgi:hypothetical protein